ncbi:MAG: hypothetical protein JXB32_22830 [Deltaproteobacteria bacterium]|nr:hypothetical protein [Deltaproteobacteria bacterium]
MRWILLTLPAALAGCYASYAADDPHDAAREADIRPDETPPDARPDDASGPPDIVGCLTDDDCAVALPEDRCCSPNPLAVHRSILDLDPCLHELGEPWGATHRECISECDHCEPMWHRYYAARCVEGTCVGVEDFCPPEAVPELAADLRAEELEDGRWREHQGRYVRVRGGLLLGPDSCACRGEPCVCRENEVQWTVGCALSLRGSTCGIPWECTGTECERSCSPDHVPMYSIVEGYVVASEATGPELWVTTQPYECAPPGPNPAGERCHIDSAEPDCADGLICFYWGDVVMGCDGECRPVGTECTVDEDCADGDVCVHGYCEWCCPG